MRNKLGQFATTINKEEVLKYISDLYAQGGDKNTMIGMLMVNFKKSQVWASNYYNLWKTTVLTNT